MVETKFFQVRDEGTHIPVLATRITVEVASDREMYRAGWRTGDIVIFVMQLNNRECQYDPTEWSNGPRTMPIAHRHILENWRLLNNHDVIDVEFILGETATKKGAE